MREIRLSGSVRGVRRNPYPYRDNLHPLRSSAGFIQPDATAFTTGEHKSGYL
jgi:hypothetical protein